MIAMASDATIDVKTLIQEGADLTDKALEKLLPSADTVPVSIHSAMRHSVFAGGKRLRPVLAMQASVAIAGRLPKGIERLGAAIEMIHTYSLIHDDLPALDNDDLRRGKATNHKVFGEAIAILAGDALLTFAFQTLAMAPVEPQRRLALLAMIAEAAGTDRGMIGGQVADLEAEGKPSDKAMLEYIHRSKTAALIRASIVAGAIAAGAGFSILKFLLHIKEEILLVLATSSSETALPTLMEKLEKLGCSRSLVGLVIPTGYTFNTDGSGLYMTLAALFVAQATNTHLTLLQQLTLFSVATLTSKGASGVQGASFIALVATLSVIPTIPVAGMALILGIDRFMSMCRGLVNMIGNGIATLVVARWENELSGEALRGRLA